MSPEGKFVEAEIELRTNPVSLKQCRIAFSRAGEHEPGVDRLPAPPPDAKDSEKCPFCRPQIFKSTPRLIPEIAEEGILTRGKSILFPNMFPYGSYSAVAVFDEIHFVEIGDSDIQTYADGFANCAEYLKRVVDNDHEVIYTAITQNHLPSSGGSLLHPHLQIQADRIASNHHRLLTERAEEHYRSTGLHLFSDYAKHEIREEKRYIGNTGPWEWMAAFAPEGFFELWGIFPGVTSVRELAYENWKHLACGVLNAQRFYRSLNRNGYNLGILSIENEASMVELRVVMLVRSNYAPWTRNDRTGFELMLGDMATFLAPEKTAELARPFWNDAS